MKTFTKILNYLLGAAGMFLFSGGFILTVGQLNSMRIDPASQYRLKPGDLFDSPVVSFLFIWLPLLLMKHTLGKSIKFFHFSNKVIVWTLVITVVLGFFAQLGKTYNYFTYVDEDINRSYKDIDIVYRKMIETTTRVEAVSQNYMKYENTLFTSLAQARTRYVNASTVNDKVDAANTLDQELKSLAIYIENYPALRSNDNVTKLVDVIIEDEAELAEYKRTYNSRISRFNTEVKSFPYVLIARAFGFTPRPYFESVK